MHSVLPSRQCTASAAHSSSVAAAAAAAAASAAALEQYPPQRSDITRLDILGARRWREQPVAGASLQGRGTLTIMTGETCD